MHEPSAPPQWPALLPARIHQMSTILTLTLTSGGGMSKENRSVARSIRSCEKIKAVSLMIQASRVTEPCDSRVS